MRQKRAKDRLTASYTAEERPSGDGERRVLVETVKNVSGKIVRTRELQVRFNIHPKQAR